MLFQKNNVRVLGIIGNPLQHSFSPAFYCHKIAASRMKFVEFHSFPLLSIEQFPDLLINNPNIQGLCVTIPYKALVIPYLDRLDVTARAVGAVNCIEWKNCNATTELIGHNTDVDGFMSMVKQFKWQSGMRALILGTGGASKAVMYALKLLGVDYQLVSRTSQHEVLTYAELNEQRIKAVDIVINTTPLGMYPHIDSSPQIPYQYLSSHHCVVDLVYNPSETLFLRNAFAQGCTGCGGLKMLNEQAEINWRIWNNDLI